MDPVTCAKVRYLRRIVRKAYDLAVQNGHVDGWKTSDGAISLHWPPYPGDEGPKVEIYSYQFGSPRHHHFDTVDEAIDAVTGWVKSVQKPFVEASWE